MLTQEEIYQNKGKYIAVQGRVNVYNTRYEYFYKNQVGIYFKNRIIKSLRLDDEIRTWLEPDGHILCPELVEGQWQYKPSDLTYQDIMRETSLPRTAVNVLKTYSVGVLPKADVEGETEWQWVREFENREQIHRKIQRLVTDMLVYGNAFFKIEADEDGRASVVVVSPDNVAIVPDNFNNNNTAGFIYHASRKDYLLDIDYDYYEIYTNDGQVRKYGKGGMEPIETGLKECNMHHIKGLESHDEFPIYGASIYEGLETVFIELVERLTSNSYLFNKVNNPNMVAASDFSQTNPITGEKEFRTGKMLVTGDVEEANSVRYIEPATSQVAVMTEHITNIFKQAFQQLGVNEVSLGLTDLGSLPSGEAFRRAITPTINKCRDITNALYDGLINMYKQAYKIDTGKDLSVNVTFSDGISLSDAEKIQNDAGLINAKILSRRTILASRGYTEQEALEELQKIAEDDAIVEPAIDTINPEDIA